MYRVILFLLSIATGIVALAADLTRPQTPAPPFAYSREAFEIRSPDDGALLAGELVVPHSSGPVPAAILLSVAGPNDRNQSFAGHQSFFVLADYLARHGVASVRLDDRGINGSGGDYFSAGWDTLATDANSIFEALRGDKRINPEGIGFIGMSQGAAVGALAARENEETAFVVLLSAPGLPGRDALVQQLETTLALSGVSGALADDYRTRFREFLFAVESARLDAEQRQALGQFLQARGRDLLPQYGFVPTDTEGQVRMLTGDWYWSNLNFDPEVAYGALRPPVLAIGGGLDPVAPPAHHLVAIRHILADAPTASLRVEERPGLNHLLQPANTGLPGEYAIIPETLDVEAMGMVSDWVNGAARR